MAIKQLSVFVENRRGRLTTLTGIIAEHNIDFRTTVIAETSDFGILRCIVEDPENAAKILNENGFTASLSTVTPVVIPDKPGAVHNVLKLLSSADIDVKYMYSSITRTNQEIIIILKTSDTEKTEEILSDHYYKICTLEDLK